MSKMGNDGVELQEQQTEQEAQDQYEEYEPCFESDEDGR